MFIKKMDEICAINEELKRLHEIFGVAEPKTNGVIYQSIMKLQNTLDEIARKRNGLEY